MITEYLFTIIIFNVVLLLMYFYILFQVINSKAYTMKEVFGGEDFALRLTLVLVCVFLFTAVTLGILCDIDLTLIAEESSKVRWIALSAAISLGLNLAILTMTVVIYFSRPLS